MVLKNQLALLPKHCLLQKSSTHRLRKSVFGVKHFHDYLIGCHFSLVTDHRPLLALFNEQCAIPSHSSACIQRWAMTLAAYEYTLTARRTNTHANADALSRLPQGQYWFFLSWFWQWTCWRTLQLQVHRSNIGPVRTHCYWKVCQLMQSVLIVHNLN